MSSFLEFESDLRAAIEVVKDAMSQVEARHSAISIEACKDGGVAVQKRAGAIGQAVWSIQRRVDWLLEMLSKTEDEDAD